MYDIEIADLRKLIELVKEKYDYDFKNYAMSSFKRRIKRIVELYKFDSVDALVERLTHNPTFFDEFVSEVTVNVTEMFRDPNFWTILRDEIIPNILSNHNKLSIWHAGCSSGEEVFSMQILLEEMGVRDKSHTIATDIDSAIINRAKEATVSKKNIELNSSNYERYQGKYTLDKYFTEDKEKYNFNKQLLSNVSFRKHDLVKGQVFSKFDLILCRNVMIYFNQTLQNDVLYLLHESLFKYGFLCIGSKESLIWCDIANKFIVINNEEKIYKKVKE
ncbi:MAG: chemotaxis protein CheR [Thalassobius sp.]|nr:chemotaxis protein CheR [Thalassovita sp.]